MSRRMSPGDAVWIRGDTPQNQVLISAVLWFDEPLGPSALERILVERLLERHPVFSQRIISLPVPGLMPRWVDDEDFDLADHLHIVDLPPPGDHELLQQLCSEERSTPLDPTKPLWSVTLYRGYRGDGSALHVRIHHSFGDGLALMQLLLSLVDEFDPATVPVIDPLPAAAHARMLTQRTLRGVTGLARAPSHGVDLARELADVAGWSARLLRPVPAPPSLLQGLPSGHKRMVWSPDGLPVSALLDAAHEHGVKANDLLLTVMTGGLRRYLDERDAVVEDVLVMVPINLRPPGLALPRHLGNLIGLMPVLLPVGRDDPEERLVRIREQTAQLKSSRAPAVSRGLLIATTLLTPGIERAIHRLNQRFSTGVVTNVIGPDLRLHLAGARMVGAIGWGGATGNLNLSAGFISVGGRVFGGLVTDAAITPDPERVLSHVEAEWADLIGTAAG